jgi:hypothetical protein
MHEQSFGLRALPSGQVMLLPGHGLQLQSLLFLCAPSQQTLSRQNGQLQSELRAEPSQHGVLGHGSHPQS